VGDRSEFPALLKSWSMSPQNKAGIERQWGIAFPSLENQRDDFRALRILVFIQAFEIPRQLVMNLWTIPQKLLRKLTG
jgi:hypothetical protein